jgi:hypothetical protein
MMEIHIKTVPHENQAYSTAGNYWYDEEGILQVRVSNMNNKKFEFLVALHELVEQFITENHDPEITEQEITNFDLYYEERRKQGLVPENSEPGFDEHAPYRNQHCISQGVEMIVAGIIGVDWMEYDRTVMSL